MRVGSAAHVRIKGFTCVSRGLRTHSGVNVRTHNVAVGSLSPWPGTRQCARATHTPGNCPKRRPLRCWQPIFSVFHRGGLRFGRHTTSNRGRATANLGELRHARVRHAGDTPSEGFAWRKTPTATSGERAAGGREGLAAAPVGGGGAWPGFKTSRRSTRQRAKRRRCGGRRRVRRARAGFEEGPGCGAGGRRQGQGGPRDRPLRAAGSRVAISRAGRRPPAHTAARPSSARNTRGVTGRPSIAGI